MTQPRSDDLARGDTSAATPRTINLTPSPAEHLRILARLADGATPVNYVSDELRRMAGIFERAGVTWERLSAFLNRYPEACEAINELTDDIDPTYRETGIRADERLRVLQDFVDPLPDEPAPDAHLEAAYEDAQSGDDQW